MKKTFFSLSAAILLLLVTLPVPTLHAQNSAFGYEMKDENCHNPRDPDAVQKRCRPADQKSCNVSEQTSCPR